jgi:DNA-binding LacI/PurR family transcriptional regulator
MTLEKVARRARVSPATVSRVMSNKISVSGSALARVLKAIEYLNYSPILIARGLAGVSRSVGVIVSYLENPFLMDLCKSIEEEAERAGFDSCWPTPVTVRSV